MTLSQELAYFVVTSSYDDLSESARLQLKIRILDSLGCAIGALRGEPTRLLKEQIDDFGGKELCSLIGGGMTAPDRAAFYNSALIRYLDFNDSYLAKHETCHPSDNLGAILAAAEYGTRSGRDMLTALAVAYQVQCRLSDEAPVRAKGFDHTTQGSYGVAAGVSKILGLSQQQTANAIALCGTAFNALRVTRTGSLSHWKGLAYPNTAFACTHAVFLAMRGITGPEEVFEGNKGFMDSIAGRFDIRWKEENLERVNATIIKKFNAEIHSQSALEGMLELKAQHGFSAADIRHIEIDIFDVAFNIIGGGEEGDKTIVRTKEEADHSLQYMVAAAILDGQVMPEQYEPERILRRDIQDLLQRIKVRPKEEYTARFPQEMPCHLRVTLKDGAQHSLEKRDYKGFVTNPFSWDEVLKKFDHLASPHADASLRQQIADMVYHLESAQIKDLANLLHQVKPEA
jgi:2-methylcitrate dehydratase